MEPTPSGRASEHRPGSSLASGEVAVRGVLSPLEREHAAWAGNIEHHVIIPIKYALALLLSLHWMWARGWEAPSTTAFGLCVIFLLFNAAAHYFFARDRITPQQVAPFLMGMFVADAGFVAALVVADHFEASGLLGGDYRQLFILAVLRGFGLFRSRMGNVFGFLLVSALFGYTAWLDLGKSSLLEYPADVRSVALTWGVMLVAQAFVGLVNARHEEQVRVRERVVRGSSLAAIGELSAGVAHEINNPIGIIKTYADFLDRSLPPGDAHREDVQAIRNEAERCEKIVRRMLDFSNPRVQAFAPIDVTALARETVTFVFHEGRGGSAVGAFDEPTAALPHVSGDAVQLRQALLNVLVNARQLVDEHAPGGGEVRVSLSRATGPRAPVCIAVLDDGPGLTSEDAERVFEPFFTKRDNGTGLGLAITRRIVEAHGGTIRIEPRRDARGACVTITLPIDGEDRA